jgi:hypothetical protein
MGFVGGDMEYITGPKHHVFNAHSNLKLASQHVHTMFV